MKPQAVYAASPHSSPVRDRALPASAKAVEGMGSDVVRLTRQRYHSPHHPQSKWAERPIT